MKKETLTDVCLVLVVLLFAYTAASKLMEHAKFLFQLGRSPLSIIYNNALLISWVLPIFEIGIALSLLNSRSRLFGLYAATLLLVIFEIYITAMLLSGKHLPCSCGGIISKLTWKQHLFFNATFICFGLLAIFNINRTPEKSIDKNFYA